jgi:hypothetical protein
MKRQSNVRRANSLKHPSKHWTVSIAKVGDPPTEQLVVVDTATQETLVRETIPPSEFGVAETAERVLTKLGAPDQIQTDSKLPFIMRNFRILLKTLGIRHSVVSVRPIGTTTKFWSP